MYQGLLRNVLQPAHESLIKRRNVRRYQRLLRSSEWWSPDQLRAFQHRELSALLQHAYHHIPFWRERLRRLRITPESIRSISDLTMLPILEKKDIRDYRDRMVADHERNTLWAKSTGGSTGEPVHFYYTADSYDWRRAATRRGYEWAGAADGTPTIHVWGVALQNQSRLSLAKQVLHRRVLRQTLFNAFEFDVSAMARCVRAINRQKPAAIVGYTNPLVTLARFVNDGQRLTHYPKAVISAAETLFDYQRREIEGAFRCRVFNTYGSREFMLIAAECGSESGLHISAENLIVEVVREDGTPAQPGEAGEIVITDLHNFGMPFIRYRIGDVGTLSRDLCSCGRGLPLLQNVLGRSLDMIRTATGKALPGEFFPHVMKDFSWVDKFQVVQDSGSSVRIRIVCNGDRPAESFGKLDRLIGAALGDGIAIQYEFVPDIPLTKTGKRRVTISALTETP